MQREQRNCFIIALVYPVNTWKIGHVDAGNYRNVSLSLGCGDI
uniref:Uncharacterized protein n=1 Tax=Arundo donax TaxID=35708 RepID=A0A0A8ZFD8_ARUDO